MNLGGETSPPNTYSSEMNTGSLCVAMVKSVDDYLCLKTSKDFLKSSASTGTFVAMV